MRDAAALDAYLRSVENMKCDYKRFDCVRFAVGWAALRGRTVDLPRWSSPAGALRAVSREGRRLADLVTARLGEPVAPREAPWGSIIALSEPPLDPLGIKDGSTVIFLSPLGGFYRRPLRDAAFAWRL